MIVSVEEVRGMMNTAGFSDEIICEKLKALELMIRSYTHNNFQNKNVQFYAKSEGGELKGSSPFLRTGDTVQISQSSVNDGLYEVLRVTDQVLQLNTKVSIYDVNRNLVTKVEYPADVKQGVMNLLKWEVENRDKVGIKSETLSRHSVTYYDQDTNNTVMGYPVSLMGFLKPYVKARF